MSATTDCKEMGYNLVQEARTAPDGSFYIPGFLDANCKRVRLSAAKTEDLWLRTGRDVFYDGDIGATPVVEVPASGSPVQTEIALGIRGASVSFRVRDTATDRYIWSELYVKRFPVPGAKFGSIEIATGHDGSPDTLLLPAGQYEVFVDQFACKEAQYFVKNPPRETFTVQVGQKIAKDIVIDVRLIKPAKTYSNPRGVLCKP